MASAGTHNEVNSTLSVDGQPSADKHVDQTSKSAIDGPTASRTLAESAPSSNAEPPARLSDQEQQQKAHGSKDEHAGVTEETAGPETPLYASDTDGSRADSTDQNKDGHAKFAAKKFTSFKPVSITKNFLAKTAAAPVLSKLGDKGSATTPQQSVLKPRLVAKSGVSTLRDTPRLKTTTDGPSEGATVWNKNRPTPTAPTKQFTDEELKQQYGIHLAERLRADASSHMGKWADDDDDDEDDWAPETVVWMDGTKSTIVPSDNMSPATAKASLAPQAEDKKPQIKPTLTALKRPVINGPLKTILRPGAAQLAKQDSSSQRSTPDQTPKTGSATTVAMPVKSPWAALPPVEKVAPLHSPPPQQQQHHPQPRSDLGHRDAHGFDAMPASAPAREIEAESFDRTWKGEERQPARELYNSQSGRYEPAPEGRRAGNRLDGGRPPSVMHRPFQTDGIADRRPSIGGRHNPDGRTGVVIGHNLAPQAAKPDPDQAQRAALEQQASDARAEEYARQQKMMREKRELAIQRRKEQDEREEAAKQERIRLKMQSLPPLAQSMTASTSSSVVPTADQGHNAKKQSEATAGAVAPRNHEDRAPAAQQSPSAKAGVLSPGQSNKVPARASQLADAGSNEQKPPASFKSPALSADSFATWGPSSNNNNTTSSSSSSSNVWGPQTGPLSSGRRIGNGAFDSPFSRIAPRLQPQQADIVTTQPSHPHQRSRALSQEQRQQDTSPMMHQQLLSDQFVTALGLNDESMDERLAAGRGVPPTSEQQTGRSYQPAPIARPSRVTSMHDSTQQAPARPGVAAWGQFAAQAQNDHARGVMDPSFQQRARDEPRPVVAQNPQRWKETFKQTRVGSEWLGGPRDVVNTETTVRGPQSPKSPTVAPPQHIGGFSSPLATGHSGQESTVRLPSGPSSAIRSASVAYNSARTAGGAGQQSRFFPTTQFGNSPPPEEAEHPAFARSPGQPLVHLPQPRAHVRLPPASVVHVRTQDGNVASGGSDWQSKFNGLFGRSASIYASAPLSPPKTPPEAALALARPNHAVTRAELHEQHPTRMTTVSLPHGSGRVSLGKGPEDFATKSPVDLLFEGELSFGSTPTVKLPARMAYADKETTTSRNDLPLGSPVKPDSKQSSMILHENGRHKIAVRIAFYFSSRPATEVVLHTKTSPSEQARKGNKSRGKATKRGESNNVSGNSSPSASPAIKGKAQKGPGAAKWNKGAEEKRPRKPSDRIHATKTRQPRASKAAGTSSRQMSTAAPAATT